MVGRHLVPAIHGHDFVFELDDIGNIHKVVDHILDAPLLIFQRDGVNLIEVIPVGCDLIDGDSLLCFENQRCG